MTVREVADALGMHVETVRIMCRTGEMRSFRRPGRAAPYRIPASAIEDWKARNFYNPAAR